MLSLLLYLLLNIISWLPVLVLLTEGWWVDSFILPFEDLIIPMGRTFLVSLWPIPLKIIGMLISNLLSTLRVVQVKGFSFLPQSLLHYRKVYFWLLYLFRFCFDFMEV